MPNPEYSAPGNCTICLGKAGTKTIVDVFDLFDHPGNGHKLCLRCGITFDSNVNELIDIKLSRKDIRNIDDREAYRRIFVETNKIDDLDGNIYADFGWENNDDLKGGVVKHAIGAISKYYTGESAPVILDLGCGNGFTTIELAKHYGGANLTAVDPSPEVEKIDGVGAISAYRGTLDSLSFPDASFDVVVMFGNFMLHNNPAATLLEIQRVLKPGGVLVMDFKNINSTLRWLLKGFTRIGMIRLMPRYLVQRAFVNMRFGFHREYVKRLAEQSGLEKLGSYSKPPRLLEFNNSDSLQRGWKGMVWRLTDTLDRWRDQRAWMQMTFRKP